MLLPYKNDDPILFLEKHLKNQITSKYIYPIIGWHLARLLEIIPTWAMEHIISKIDGSDDSNRLVWTGLIRSKTIPPDLLPHIISPLSKLVQNKNKTLLLGEKNKNTLIELYIRSCLQYPDLFSRQDPEPQAILDKLKSNELLIAIQYIYNYLRTAKDPKQLWKENIFPWVKKNWPQKNSSLDQITIYWCKIILIIKPKNLNDFENYLHAVTNKHEKDEIKKILEDSNAPKNLSEELSSTILISSVDLAISIA